MDDCSRTDYDPTNDGPLRGNGHGAPKNCVDVSGQIFRTCAEIEEVFQVGDIYR